MEQLPERKPAKEAYVVFGSWVTILSDVAVKIVENPSDIYVRGALALTTLAAGTSMVIAVNRLPTPDITPEQSPKIESSDQAQ